jgi:hypothetical protein
MCSGNMFYPDLKFNSFILSENGLDLEVDADSRNKGRRERVVSVSERLDKFVIFRLVSKISNHV